MTDQQKPTNLTKSFMERWLKATHTPRFYSEPESFADAQDNARFFSQNYNLLFLEFGELTEAIEAAAETEECTDPDWWRDEYLTARQTTSLVLERWNNLRMFIHHRPHGWEESRAVIIDALGDIAFLCWKMCEGMGVDFFEVLERVAASNATKLIDKPVEVLPDGHIVKKAHYVPPDFTDMLCKTRENANKSSGMGK